jgi:hypothetical protein
MTAKPRAAPKRGSSANGKPPKPVLPEVSTAKLEEAMRLVEALVAEKTSVFVEKVADYREVHREGTSRPLSALESAQIHAAIAVDALEGSPADAISDIQSSDLRAFDEPSEQEVLMAAGVATAPEFIDAVKRFCVLIEMDNDTFRTAREAGEDSLEAAIESAVSDLDYLPVETETRPRAMAALEHFSKEVGAGSGKGLALMAQTILQALGQAMSASRSESSTSSLVDMGGDESTSSTSSPTETPSTT